DLVSPPGKTQRLRHQHGFVTDSDTIYSPARLTGRLQPGPVADSDAIASVTVDNRNTLRPALVSDADSVFAFRTTHILQPPVTASDDTVPAADGGWKLFVDAPVTDADAAYGVFRIDRTVPVDTWFDEETIDTYPFFLQRLEGGVPVPA